MRECGYTLANDELEEMPGSVWHGDQWTADNEAVESWIRSRGVVEASSLTGEPQLICEICGVLPRVGVDDTVCDPEKHAAYYAQFPRGDEA